MQTRQAQIIEQVAFLILDADLTSELAASRNAGEGWTFGVRWADSEYISETDFTRCEGYRLTEADLNDALATAERWVRGDFGPEAY